MRNTLRSEWTKLTSLRSTYVTVGLTVVLALGLTALVSIVIGATWSDWKPVDRADFEPVLTTLIGGLFSAIVLIVLGVKVVSSEYASGMIRLTFTATPRRERVLLAKLAIVTGVTLVLGAVTTFGMFLLGQAILGAYGAKSAGLGDPDVMRTLLATTALTPFFPLIGAALASLLRSTAGAITTVLGLIFVPGIFGSLLPASWQENVLAYLPGAAGDSLSVAPLEPDPTYLATGVAIVVLVAWLALFLGGTYAALVKRDA